MTCVEETAVGRKPVRRDGGIFRKRRENLGML